MGIKENVAAIRAEIDSAAIRAGRDPGEIKIVAATKMNDCARVREAVEAGVEICGENRVQEMTEKLSQGAYEGAELHFIGHLQKNKVKQVVGAAKLIHSVDTAALMDEIDRIAEKKGIVQDILIEINVGGEESKSGFEAGALPGALAHAAELEHIRVRGLMTIPPKCEHGEENRHFFDFLHQLSVDNGGKKYDNVSMDFLSMGMSDDYAVAVECGASFVRIGTAIFGQRNYAKPSP